MFETWFNVLHLAAEAQEVVGLRVLKLVQGGTEAQDEALRMVAEKIDAGTQAMCQAMAGVPAACIVAGFRSEVQANAARLLGEA